MFAAPPPEEAADGRAWFQQRFDVSRETMALLDRYAALLSDWQGKFNLVGPSTLPQVWVRHFADSAQLVALAEGRRWLDIGSGAGFPGMVIALLTASEVHLVDSVRKKSTFLETVRAELGLESRVKIHNIRVESLREGRFDVVTARACAPLATLFDWSLPSTAQSATWLLLKGATVEDEIAEARKRFDFDFELIPSVTDSRGRIVRARNVRGRRGK
jgi:16S rRNA (guanine527-N7)-methyltransferase